MGQGRPCQEGKSLVGVAYIHMIGIGLFHMPVYMIR